MKKLRWQVLVVALTILVAGGLLLTQQPSGTTTSPEAVSGGIYTEALVGAFGRLNPLLDLTNNADRQIDRLIFSSLVKFDSRGIPIPDLAESWGVSADGTVYNITLRTGAVWQDGEPITSDDVLFTLNLLRSEYSSFPDDVKSLWDQVEISKINDNNLKFVIPEPFAPFMDYLTFGILPKHILDAIPAEQFTTAEFNINPIGSGPYKFDHLMGENGNIIGVVLSASPSFYGQKPYIEQIVFRYYSDSESALNAYESGEVLGVSEITTDVISQALALPNLSMYSSRMPSLTMIFLNLGDNQVAFLQDKRIRMALMQGINRQRIVDTLLQGQGLIADSPILPGTWASYEGIEHLDYDPDAAINILKSSGYLISTENIVRSKDGVALSFTMLYPEDDLHKQLAEMIRDDWAVIGVELKIQPVSYDSLLNDYLSPRTYQSALVDLDLSRSYDPDPYPFWHQAEKTGGQNYSQWDNRTASEYLEQARVTTDLDFRARLYRNFQVIFSRELPALLLYYPIYTFGADQRVQGIQGVPLFEPADRFSEISNWYLVTKRTLGQTGQ